MALRIKKTKKSRKQRGQTTYGHGARKKWKKSGHRGGTGMAGTGKRADQKKTLILNMPEKYFGKDSLKPKPKNYGVINIKDIEKRANGKSEVDLSNFKLLGSGEITFPVTLKVYSASKSAVKKIEKAGGKVIVKYGHKESS